VHGIDTGSVGLAVASPIVDDGTTWPEVPTAPTAARADRTTSTLVVPRRPRLIRLPIGLCVPVRPVGTTSNGLLDMPADVDVAGWWEGGSRLGDPSGSMLVVAQVDARTEALGPFASLLTARPGERVRVWGGGLRRTFEVRARRLRPHGSIAPTSWLRSPQGPARRTLVTCAGPYDPDAGGYQNLAVIVAFPIGAGRLRR
jgi:hypothetical protein